MEIMINIVVLLLSATNKETLYEQLVQAAGKREGRHGPKSPFFLAYVETSPISLVSRWKRLYLAYPFPFPRPS